MQSTGVRRTPKTLAAKVRSADHPSDALSLYQKGLEAMQQGQFDRARLLLQSLDSSCPAEIQERVRVYLAACERHLERHVLSFATPEEQYDYAISRINTGDYEEAREQLEQIVAAHADADYAHYGLAVLSSMTGQAELCLEHLAQSIALNPRSRLQARSDADFRHMTDDPRFTELLYPEMA
jgi:outer membrane protein assembly factor BamD (BamD/ComL family)